MLAALSYVCSAASAQAACDAAASSNGVRRLPCCIRYLDSVVALQWVSIPLLCWWCLQWAYSLHAPCMHGCMCQTVTLAIACVRATVEKLGLGYY